MLMKKLVLFDIDGTLTRTQNGYLPFNEAVLKTFGISGDIRTVVPDGNGQRMELTRTAGACRSFRRAWTRLGLMRGKDLVELLVGD